MKTASNFPRFTIMTEPPLFPIVGIHVSDGTLNRPTHITTQILSCSRMTTLCRMLQTIVGILTAANGLGATYIIVWSGTYVQRVHCRQVCIINCLSMKLDQEVQIILLNVDNFSVSFFLVAKDANYPRHYSNEPTSYLYSQTATLFGTMGLSIQDR